MKKTAVILCVALFCMTIFFPIGVIVFSWFGYSFELGSVSAFTLVIEALSICAVLFGVVSKAEIKSKAFHVLMALLAPLSLVNAVFYIYYCHTVFVIAGMSVSAICACALSIKYGKPLGLKIASLIVWALMVLPVCVISFVFLVFGEIGHTAVVNTVDSPNGRYYAQVVDSDQGALGGDTVVYVYEPKVIDLYILKIEKKPQVVYFGEWAEFRTMEISWKNENCLIINSVEYPVD